MIRIEAFLFKIIGNFSKTYQKEMNDIFAMLKEVDKLCSKYCEIYKPIYDKNKNVFRSNNSELVPNKANRKWMLENTNDLIITLKKLKELRSE